MPGWASEPELTLELRRCFQGGGDVSAALLRLRQEGYVERREHDGQRVWRYRPIRLRI